jgi:GNAT superfamily N-acetyltransferase
MHSHMSVELAAPDAVRPLRELHRREMNCQIVLDSWLGRGWADAYLLRVDGRVVGYGLVGGVRANPKDTITEFYVLPPDRGAALPLFRTLIVASGATGVEAQTNDVLLTLMLYDCGTGIESTVVLFHDAFKTSLPCPGGTFRASTAEDRARVAAQQLDPDAGWLVEEGGAIVAAGGVLCHYNPPYGDIFMGVAEPFRRRGYGSYLVQELKRAAYEMGKVPAARCNAANGASRATLQRAGLMPCARVLTGRIAAPTVEATESR